MSNQHSGTDAFQANIEAMREVGRQAEKRRTEAAAARLAAHEAAMAARAKAAEEKKTRLAGDGVRRRNAHNERLALQRAEREDYRDRLKVRSVRI